MLHLDCTVSEKNVFAFYAEIQDGRPKCWENDFWRKSRDYSVNTLGQDISGKKEGTRVDQPKN